MGKKSTPKAPATPDYAAAATAQGDANLDAARLGAELNNTNQNTPYGSQTFTKDPGSDQWTSTVSLSPEQQSIYDQQTQGDLRLGQMANSQLDRINDTVSKPFDTSQAPDRVNSVAGGSYSQYDGSNPAYSKYTGDQPSYARAGAGPTYDMYNGASMDLPDYGKQAQEVEDSLYSSATKRLDPEWQQQENSERTRLINAGVAEGSEAFNNAINSFNQNKQAAYGDARDRAIQGRGTEQSRLNADYLAGQGQKFGQDITALNTNNTARSQQYADALRGLDFNNTASGKELTDRLSTLGFNNATTQQEFNDQLQKLGFNNQTEAQGFADRLAGGNFQNTQRGAALDEEAFMRSEPLNMYSALSSGSQVTNPQFRGTGQVQAPTAAPTFAATQAQNQSALDLYNAQLANSGSASSGLMGMLGSLGGAAITKWSDRRLKTDITRIGALSTGLPVYSYKIFGKADVGVMADEARTIHPEAVTRMPNGYDMVDYSKVAR